MTFARYFDLQKALLDCDEIAAQFCGFLAVPVDSARPMGDAPSMGQAEVAGQFAQGGLRKPSGQPCRNCAGTPTTAAVKDISCDMVMACHSGKHVIHRKRP